MMLKKFNKFVQVLCPSIFNFCLPFHFLNKSFFCLLFAGFLQQNEKLELMFKYETDTYASTAYLVPLYVNSLPMYRYWLSNAMVSKLILLKWIFKSLHRAGR
jgi:hypothetical protein